MAEYNPWVGFDLDGTLAKYTRWNKKGLIGEIVPKMAKRLQMHLDKGETVKIFTARAAKGAGEKKKIQRWLLKNGLPALEVTNEKDPGMIKLYDDRAISVEKNTGEIK